MSLQPGGQAVTASAATDESAGARGCAPPPAASATPGVDPGELARKVVAAFRRHPHINNVMTHISGARWEKIEQAVRVILDPAMTREQLSPLAHNIVQLMWAEGGVTGRILKPHLRATLTGMIPRPAAERLLTRIADLCEPPQVGTAFLSRDGPA